MEQSHAQRTLVKSPPELWAELSSEDSLGRHLAEFGEIRITRVKPENTVAWEGDRASGTVQIEPTGWGTKVTLTAEPVVAEAVVEPEPAVEPEPIADPEAVVTPEPAAEPEPAMKPEPEPAASMTRISLRQVDTPEQPAVGDDEVPRRFLARFFRRPAATQDLARASIPAPPAPTPDPSPPTPVPAPAPSPPPAPDPTPPAPDPAPGPPPTIERPRQPAPLDPDRTAAILSEVLDDLGAAHHRPFSRG